MRVDSFAPLQRGFDLPSDQVIEGEFPVVYSNGILNYHNFPQAKGPGVVTGRSGTIGKVTYVENDYWPHNTTLWVTDFKGNVPKFVYYFYDFLDLERYGTGSGVPTLNRNDIHSLRISVPPLAEQRAIARVLGTMDELIAKTSRMVEQKKLRRKYLMQALLTGKKRLKGFRGKWRTLPFRELATESVFRNGGKMSNDRLMAVSKVHGMIPMRERVQGESNHRCKVVRQDYFAYNPMRLNIGSLARWADEVPAMVSGDYVVFKCEEERLDPRFFDFYRSSNEWANYVRRAGDGSVRVRIYFSHLAPFKITLPSIKEQKAIANILDIATCEITMLEAKYELLKLQKKWLMQQLLTGKRRLEAEEH